MSKPYFLKGTLTGDFSSNGKLINARYMPLLIVPLLWRPPISFLGNPSILSRLSLSRLIVSESADSLEDAHIEEGQTRTAELYTLQNPATFSAKCDF